MEIEWSAPIAVVALDSISIIPAKAEMANEIRKHYEYFMFLAE